MVRQYSSLTPGDWSVLKEPAHRPQLVGIWMSGTDSPPPPHPGYCGMGISTCGKYSETLLYCVR